VTPDYRAAPIENPVRRPYASHRWPVPILPIAKQDRTCLDCGMRVTVVKHQHQPHASYTWAVAWQHGEDHGIVRGMRDIPRCRGAMPQSSTDLERKAFS
jgi:hypothetical protein